MNITILISSHIGNKKAIEIANAIKVNFTLQSLNLYNNLIDNRGTVEIVKALREKLHFNKY